MKTSDHLNLKSTFSDEERQLALDLAAMIEHSGEGLKVAGAGSDEVDLPVGLGSLLAQAARLIAAGNDVAIASRQAEITPRQAADMLNVSRPHLVALLDRGEIPFHRVGTHRRIRLSDLLEYKQRRDGARDAELRRISELSREIGIPE